MQTIPLQPVPSQTVNVSLAGQPCQINVYSRGASPFLFVDLYLNGVLVIGGVMARNAVRIVRDLYLGFAGDLAFYDTQGATDPAYTGLGGRYALIYLETSDLGGLG